MLILLARAADWNVGLCILGNGGWMSVRAFLATKLWVLAWPASSEDISAARPHQLFQAHERLSEELLEHRSQWSLADQVIRIG